LVISQSSQKKKFTSSVLCASFHPSSRVIIAGSADFSVRILTCYNKVDDGDGYKGIFDNIKTEGEELYRIETTKCWVNSV